MINLLEIKKLIGRRRKKIVRLISVCDPDILMLNSPMFASKARAYQGGAPFMDRF